jgi:REP element-mobilizing transposase RayT
MSVRREIPFYEGQYFITITCARWINLFEITNGYDVVYTWFDYLKSKGHLITGYVVMPNHLHALIAFRNTTGQSINAIVGNGKRFMAYELVNRLKTQGHDHVLQELSSYVNKTEKRRGKQHEVFEPSFDWKKCDGEDFILQKLDYIHENPCRGKWNLVDQSENYMHSSARYYSKDEQGVYEVLSYMKLNDIDLTKPWLEAE